MGQDRPINALLPGFAQVHVFNSTRIKPFIPIYMPIAMYLGVFAQNTPRSRVSACFHLPSTAPTALHVLSKCQTLVKESTKKSLDAARKDGRIGGRKPKLKPQQQQEILQLVRKGKKTAADAARLFAVHQATVTRLLQRKLAA